MQWPRVFSEPAVATPPRRVWRDWALVGIVTVAAIVEAAVVPGIPAPWFSALMCITFVPTVLWRRTHPAAMAYLAFIGLMITNVVVRATTGRTSEFASMVFVMILPYAVFRWGSGREMAATIPLLIAVWIIGSALDPDTASDVLGGIIVLAIPCGLGLLVRFRADARARMLDDARSRERVELARDLHDSVAHHVSAIVVQAQAGQAVAATDPAAAVGALERIEATAAATLAEMRSLVGALRSTLEFAPQTGLAQIPALADAVPDGTEVAIKLDINAGDGGPPIAEPVQVAIYRITQEALTNAVRHGRQVRHIAIDVTADDDMVCTSICNDGARPKSTPTDGYGLIGMAERARQLGGSFAAGPLPSGGWRVRATLPRATAGHRTGAPDPGTPESAATSAIRNWEQVDG